MHFKYESVFQKSDVYYIFTEKYWRICIKFLIKQHFPLYKLTMTQKLNLSSVGTIIFSS